MAEAVSRQPSAISLVPARYQAPLPLDRLILPVGAVLYDARYRAVVGLPFLSVYLSRQLGVAAEPHSPGLLAQKAYNALWYIARLVWFAFPFSVAAGVAAVRDRMESWSQRILNAADPFAL